MCLTQDKSVKHACIPSCPLCWILTESNIRRFLAGETIELGPVYTTFGEALRAGCLFTIALIRHFSQQDVVKSLDESTISVTGVANDKNSPTDLVELKFKITNPERDTWNDPAYAKQNEQILLNNPELAGKTNVQVMVEESYTIGMGLYTKGKLA